MDWHGERKKRPGRDLGSNQAPLSQSCPSFIPPIPPLSFVAGLGVYNTPFSKEPHQIATSGQLVWFRNRGSQFFELVQCFFPHHSFGYRRSTGACSLGSLRKVSLGVTDCRITFLRVSSKPFRNNALHPRSCLVGWVFRFFFVRRNRGWYIKHRDRSL